MGLEIQGMDNAAADSKNVVGYFNWNLTDESGETVILKGGKGFALFDNRYTTKQQKQLMKQAEANGGKATFLAEVTVTLVNEEEEVDLTNLLRNRG